MKRRLSFTTLLLALLLFLPNAIRADDGDSHQEPQYLIDGTLSPKYTLKGELEPQAVFEGKITLEPEDRSKVILAPEYIEAPIHVGRNDNANHGPNYEISPANDHGCNDAWAVFSSNNWRLPTGVWATNRVNRAHIRQHGGLDGYFVCYSGGSCVTYLCTKDNWGADAMSIRVQY
jgi:hypothetical protein